jgi:anti-anti-sigma factor
MLEPHGPSGTIDVSHDGHLWILAVRGEHDLATRPSLRHELDKVFDAGSRCIVDFTDAKFIDSTVLRALAYGQARAVQQEQHSLAVVAPPGGLARRLLALTGLDKTIPLYAARPEALAASDENC